MCSWPPSLAATPVHAQHVGITAGVNMAEINASGDERLNVLLTDKLELVGGIVLRGDVSDTFSIQAEALYSVKGTRFEVAGIRTDIDLNYLEVPGARPLRPPSRWPGRVAAPLWRPLRRAPARRARQHRVRAPHATSS